MSSFIQAIDIRYNHYKDYGFKESQTVLDVALKAIATATVIVPVAIGFYEIFRPRASNEFETSGIHSDSYVTKIAWTVSTLGLNILYYGVQELWARYPSRYLEQLPSDYDVDIERLRPYQFSDYLSKPGTIDRLNNVKIWQAVQRNPQAADFIFRKLSQQQFNDYIYDLIGFKKDSLATLPCCFLQTLGTELKKRNMTGEMRELALALPNKMLMNQPEAREFLLSLETNDILKKFSREENSSSGILFGAHFHQVLSKISDHQKTKLMQHFIDHPEDREKLPPAMITILLATPSSRALRRNLYEVLPAHKRIDFEIQNEKLAFSLKNNQDLYRLVPDDWNEKNRFIEKLTDCQLNEMDGLLFAKLYFQLVDKPESLKKVGISTINQIVSSLGLENRMINALPLEMLQKLDLNQVNFALRKKTENIDVQIKKIMQGYNQCVQTSTSTSTSFNLVKCSALEGNLRFIHGDLKEITITKKTTFDETKYLYQERFRNENWSQNNEDYRLQSQFDRSWDFRRLNDGMLRLTDHQIHCLTWNLDDLTREGFVQKLLGSIAVGDSARARSLNEKFQFVPQKSEEIEAFAVLGLERSCTQEEARKTYLRLARQNHPDKGGNSEAFAEIGNAWEILEAYFSQCEV